VSDVVLTTSSVRPLALMLASLIGCTTTSSSEGGASTEATASETSGGPSEDLPSDGGQCLLIEDDCMDPSLKCMPWTDTLGPPVETRCCDLAAEPVSFGERCHAQGGVFTCIDDCPAGSMCMVDDVDVLEGHCQRFCEVTVPLCLARCDPLQQDCEGKGRPGWACSPTGPQAPSFICLPPTGPTAKLEYESCMVASDCTPGLMCTPAELVLGCEGLSSCCTRYCDTTEADPCTMGNQCVSMGSTVPGLEHVGVCVDPSG
jgi:hypothetical protein